MGATSFVGSHLHVNNRWQVMLTVILLAICVERLVLAMEEMEGGGRVLEGLSGCEDGKTSCNICSQVGALIDPLHISPFTFSLSRLLSQCVVGLCSFSQCVVGFECCYIFTITVRCGVEVLGDLYIAVGPCGMKILLLHIRGVQVMSGEWHG